MGEIAGHILRSSRADQTEVSLIHSVEGLTRFAANEIHQNVAERDTQVRVRVMIGKRTGVASGNQTDDESLAAIVANAEQIARLQPENPELSSLPEPAAVPSIDAFNEHTAACGPERRAAGVAVILDRARKATLQASGAFSTTQEEMYIANSLGVEAYHPYTVGTLLTVLMGATGSGYAGAASLDIDQIDAGAIAETAVEKALSSRDPEEIEPGSYTVILEEEAMADLLFYLGYMGLGALSVQEKRSFLTGRLGEQVASEMVTLWDDGTDPRTIPLPFDFEGSPRQRVMLIEKGIARGVVYDSFTAGREPGASNTGHGLPAPNTTGPVPTHLFLAAGNVTKEEMLASTERGIWVTRFHYTNTVHPVKTILTGMTRDGTFLIEDGKIRRPLRNLRFTQSILEALGGIDMLGSTLKLCKRSFGPFAVCAPAARIQRFTFTGTTEF
ncbi:MAG: TldD/PmbA family protein [Candidatus Bipolaricaulota bacterium]|nr:MAG: TldD/PmbA family protein [Candidatus Bipolaricaulota bacterium]